MNNGQGTGTTPLIQNDAPIIFDNQGLIDCGQGCMKPCCTYKRNQVIICKPGCMQSCCT